MMEKTATFVKNVEEWISDAKLYKVEPPMEYERFDEPMKTDYVIVSAVMVYGMPETYIFPANADGEETSMGELEGSFKGALDHEQALVNAGYLINA